MHPIERLRYVARADGADPALIAIESGHALAAIAEEDPAGLVPACRRLIDAHPTSGPLWWLTAQVLASADPGPAAYRAAAELDGDRTASVLSRALPDDATVAIVGWPDAAGDALRRRGDLEVLAIDGGGEGSTLAHRLERTGVVVAEVSDAGAAAAAVVADLVIVEAAAAGPTGLLVRTGSHNAVAAAHGAGVPVWAVVATGRLLPGPLWDALLARLDRTSSEPWDRDHEVVATAMVSAVVGPDGPVGDPVAFWATSPVPPASELLRQVD